MVKQSFAFRYSEISINLNSPSMKNNFMFSLAPVYNEIEGPSFCSCLKRFHMSEGINSVTFFYSKFEHCWLMTCDFGSVTVDATPILKKDSVVIENMAIIKVGKQTFIFTNLSSCSGLSKLVVTILLNMPLLRLLRNHVIDIIKENFPECEYFTFPIDMLCKNHIFTYSHDFLCLDSNALYNDLLENKSPLLEPVEFEYKFEKKLTFKTEPLISFDVSMIEFINFFEIVAKEDIDKPDRLNWPSKERIKEVINRSNIDK